MGLEQTEIGKLAQIIASIQKKMVGSVLVDELKHSRRVSLLMNFLLPNLAQTFVMVLSRVGCSSLNLSVENKTFHKTLCQSLIHQTTNRVIPLICYQWQQFLRANKRLSIHGTIFIPISFGLP
eukprot:Protomagalhaensia_wolfi_Nauph_80__4077@NODE_4135_length_632_cov_30_849916_g3279_i0_p1_GENE_NODE_4135_length_632_cov_30_849916_g3279_i0NODE_4135_length_632_cov_30_849916_g3279_i0_p1_ORF_typecomplete_len123_score11_20_NODE_4135_length_632_cov_30_849916_g3279_i036404